MGASTRYEGVWVAAAALLVGSAAAGKESAFGPGEQTAYKVQLLGFKAGTAEITVGSQTRQWGKSVLPVVTTGRTEALGALYPVKDKFVTYWDHSQQKTIGSDLYADEGRKRRRQRIQLHKGVATVLVQREGAAEEHQRLEVDADVQDIVAAALAVRNKPLEVGDDYALPVFTGIKSFVLKAHVEGRQTLDTCLGPKPVVRVRVATDFSGTLAAKRDLVVYLTTDAAHIPVRVEADFLVGKLVAEMTEYKPGKAMSMDSEGPAPGTELTADSLPLHPAQP